MLFFAWGPASQLASESLGKMIGLRQVVLDHRGICSSFKPSAQLTANKFKRLLITVLNKQCQIALQLSKLLSSDPSSLTLFLWQWKISFSTKKISRPGIRTQAHWSTLYTHTHKSEKDWGYYQELIPRPFGGLNYITFWITEKEKIYGSIFSVYIHPKSQEQLSIFSLIYIKICLW